MIAQRVDLAEVQRLRDRGAQVLDALPADDYAKQHLPGAINVPLEEFSLDLISSLERSQAVVTYCFDNQCDLSARLAARLVLEGFSEVYEYAASLADWMAYGLPIEGESTAIAHVRDLARRDAVTCQPEDLLSDVATRLDGQNVCAVLDDVGVVVGRLARADIDRGSGSTAGDVMHPGPSTFRPDVPLSEMRDWFERRKQTNEFLITTPDGRLFGVLERQAVEDVSRAAHSARS